MVGAPGPDFPRVEIITRPRPCRGGSLAPQGKLPPLISNGNDGYSNLGPTRAQFRLYRLLAISAKSVSDSVFSRCNIRPMRSPISNPTRFRIKSAFILFLPF